MGHKSWYRHFFAGSDDDEKNPLSNQQRLLDWWRCLHPFWIQLCYFVGLSSLGFLLLRALPFSSSSQPQTAIEPLDLLFMSVSSVTVSSMATMEMEVFSRAQLTVITILMLLGGEVFTSMLSLHRNHESTSSGKEMSSSRCTVPPAEQELEIIVIGTIPASGTTTKTITTRTTTTDDTNNPYHKARSYLGFVVQGYLVVIHVVGSCCVLLYLKLVPSAGEVLRQKGINLSVFSLFTVVSTFSNCGFIPTNENMIVFSNHSGLLLILTTLVLAGNTLFPPMLRLVLWAIQWVDARRKRSTSKMSGIVANNSATTDGSSSSWSKHPLDYLLDDGNRMDYPHLLPRGDCLWLLATAGGFVLVQTLLLCSLEWHGGLSTVTGDYRKLVAAIFQSVNSRHAGESVLDLSTTSPAILVLYVVMMYLPPYTRFVPMQNNFWSPSSKDTPTPQKKAVGDHAATVAADHYDHTKERTVGSMTIGRILHGISLSQVSCLAVFTIMICITERKNISADPLNFNVLHILVEVTSAYGNVGFSTSYSCRRRLVQDPSCQDSWTGFVGRWSTQGKIILMATMFFGRLKGFSMKGGQLWKLS